jgi:hypothetical protein
VLELRGVTRRRGAFDDLSSTVGERQMLGITGPTSELLTPGASGSV